MDALLNRIVQMCKGDKKKAKALVEAAQTKYPGNTAIWYLQKVIQELEQQQAEYFRSRRLPTKRPAGATNWGEAEQQLRQRLRQPVTVSKPIQPVTSKVKSQLFTLVNGDMKTANRLLEHTRKTNPLQSEQ